MGGKDIGMKEPPAFPLINFNFNLCLLIYHLLNLLQADHGGCLELCAERCLASGGAAKESCTEEWRMSSFSTWTSSSFLSFINNLLAAFGCRKLPHCILSLTIFILVNSDLVTNKGSVIIKVTAVRGNAWFLAARENVIKVATV